MKFGPPEVLKAPSSAWLRSILSVLWIGCLAVVLYGQAVTTWFIYGGAAYGDRLMIVSQFIDVAVAILLVVAAFILRLKRFDHPVAILFSFAFLLLATVGTYMAWMAWFTAENVFDPLWISLLLIAIPALPTGRYVPRWSRWAMIVGPIGALVLLNAQFDFVTAELARGAMLLTALGCVIIRFRFTPAGAERQQLKWASLGLGAGLIMYGVSMLILLAMNMGWIPPVFYELGLYEPVRYLQYFMHRIAYLVMAGGVLVCLMDYRLNDADAAIGRSTGYALVTTLIAVIWAVSTAWINSGIALVTGGDNPTLSTALSTMVALAVLTPTQKRILSWTESRFQRALVRLRGLPERLAKWQHEDNPSPVASATLDSIADGVGASHAAVVSETPTGPRVLATHEIEADAVRAGLGPDDDSVFRLRLPLNEAGTTIGWLLLGPRSDGASYSRQEKIALALVLDPLADAIHFSSRREQRHAVLSDALKAMEARLEAMEAERNAAVARAGA